MATQVVLWIAAGRQGMERGSTQVLFTGIELVKSNFNKSEYIRPEKDDGLTIIMANIYHMALVGRHEL